MGCRRAGVVAGLILLAVTGAGCTAQRDEPRSKRPSPAAAPTAAGAPTRAGALEAAVTHLELLNSNVMYDRSRREETLRVAAHPDFHPRLPALFEGYDRVSAALGLDESGKPKSGDVIARAAALGAEVTEYELPRASVSIWTLALLGIAAPTSPHPVQERWSTEVVDVEWDGVVWRWSGLTHEDGPVPVAGGQLPSPTELLDQVPDAVRVRG